MIRVAINGYGTIGKRVADAAALQDDMKVAGVVKTRPSFEARIAVKKGFRLFTNTKDNIPAFNAVGIKISGTLDDLLKESDIVVDCTPGKVGAENKEKIYMPRKIKAIFQGGEKAKTVEASFNALCNYASCLGKNYIRVVSCNTTGLCRTLGTIDRAFGIKKARVTLVRRGADPADADTGPINAIVPDPAEVPSHHGPDVKTILPNIDIITSAMVVPTTLMHVHSVGITLSRPATREEVISAFQNASRIILVSAADGIDSTAKVMEYARELGRPRSDLYEIAIWKESINVIGDELFWTQAVHQESDVVPENIDAIRAVTGIEKDAHKSIAKTNKNLGMIK
ncbi:Glyceraldehyde-3-phosphate dehydrogenase [uncultured archaeon]|nr:Glyceraldehyde-3-phosphate dehydrogenase [uncultured archaeon]